MAYYLNIFSPETYEVFSRSDKSVSGFRLRHKAVASKIHPGDRFICYMTKLSRWIGVLEIISDCYIDETPLYYKSDDPFVVRFRVKPVAWLAKEQAVPIKEDHVWQVLSFTKAYEKSSSAWTGRFRGSLNRLLAPDGLFLEKLVVEQAKNKKIYELDEKEYEKLVTHTVRRADKTVTVSVPQNSDVEDEGPPKTQREVRESIRMQALLASIGAEMGMRIWIPRADRSNVFAEWKDAVKPVLEELPLNYDDTTLKTIEQIDVLWLRGRAIMRAFEVEHTTSIYSGLLRMADLLALQPNMDIKLHIVAPIARREKVFQELRRPVFSLLDKGPLSESCTYLSYESVTELSQLKHLAHISDTIVDEYAEEAE